MKVFVNQRDGSRKIVEAQLLEERKTTLRVRLEDGSVITRKRLRDVPSNLELDEATLSAEAM